MSWLRLGFFPEDSFVCNVSPHGGSVLTRPFLSSSTSDSRVEVDVTRRVPNLTPMPAMSQQGAVGHPAVAAEQSKRISVMAFYVGQKIDLISVSGRD